MLLILLLMSALLSAQQHSFIENKGQWEGDFDFKYSHPSGSAFITSSKIVHNLREIHPSDAEHDHPHLPPPGSNILGHAFAVTFINGRKVSPTPSGASATRYNFLLGRDQDKWKSGLKAYKTVLYEGVYPGIDIQWYSSEDGYLKYDLIIHPGSDPAAFSSFMEGLEGVELRMGELIQKTSIGEIRELKPYAFQIIDGLQKEVEVNFTLLGDTVGFEVGNYDENYPLLIDPALVFSTYSGATSDNWGYTATYGEGGTAYGGSIVFVSNGSYPSSLGAWSQTSLGGKIDIAISKFSADGSSLIYSTYIGGSNNEMPYSLIEGKNKELIILGNTGSLDFPVLSNSYQDTLNQGSTYNFYNAFYQYGCDIFLLKLDSTGGQVLASTYLGGSGVDGINDSLIFNYGDDFRGEVNMDAAGNIYGVSSTYSSDFPLAGSVSSYGGKQDGVAFSFDPGLQTLRWSKYIGGSENDALFSIKEINGEVYLAGCTSSNDISFAGVAGEHQTYFGGKTDGMILRLNSSNSNPLSFSYNGSTGRDANYFVEYNSLGEIYLFGQTTGNYPLTGDSLYIDSNSAQFLHQWQADLNTTLRSTVFGSGSHIPNISPTALMVDNCRNIYISGWGGSTGSQSGNTNGLRVTANAYRTQTDGNDFYFMVMDASWKKLNYATFFGSNMKNNQASDHVDGGTSRFSRDGTIYQAVCAGCGSYDTFPTTSNAYSQTNGSFNCNLGLVKFTIESDEVELDLKFSEDSACVPYVSIINDRSFNADIIIVERPGGQTDTLTSTQLIITDLGITEVTFIGLDTMCGFSDTLVYRFDGFSTKPVADFTIENDTCSGSFLLKFSSTSSGADFYQWDFGDGSVSNLQNPSHVYSKEGTYKIRLIVRNADCNSPDTITKIIKLKPRSGNGSFNYIYDPCTDTILVEFSTLGEGFENYIWYVDGQEVLQTDTNVVVFRFDEPGTYKIRLQSIDSLCERYFDVSQNVFIPETELKLQLPNVFTPNGDMINDEFSLFSVNPGIVPQNFSLMLYNRYGRLIFSTDNINESWDGKLEGEVLPEGVYYYLVELKDQCGNTSRTKGFVHLMP